MKSILSLTFVLIISGFCFGQADSVSIEKSEVQPVEKISTSVKVPKFSNADVQKFADEYSVYFYEIVKASKEGNEQKVNELSEKAVEWAERSQEATLKMSPEDMQKWADWAQALVAEAPSTQ